jgi:hypothetical protein
MSVVLTYWRSPCSGVWFTYSGQRSISSARRECRRRPCRDWCCRACRLIVALQKATVRIAYGWIGRDRSPGRTLRRVSNYTYRLLGCSIAAL